MKPEPLRGKRKKYKKPSGDHTYPEYVNGLSDGYESAMEDVYSAVEFYKKWKDLEPSNVFMKCALETEEPKAWKSWCEAEDKYNKRTYSLKVGTYTHLKFNDWLFDYCFGDVIE